MIRNIGEPEPEFPRSYGDGFAQQRILHLLVPSAIKPGEYNLIINSRHPDWQWKWVVSGPITFGF